MIHNWFACSECLTPTNYRKTNEGVHFGRCSKCKRLVKLTVAHDGGEDKKEK